MLNEPNADAIEFVNEFKMNLISSEIQVFTPKGHIKTLPVKATALDFAYEIHSEIGNSAMAAKVNYKLVPLNHVLNSGDQVEIITSDKKRIQREWLDYVVTAKAKGTIMNAIKSENKHRTEK
jgi:GTP pyrophosphokinase